MGAAEKTASSGKGTQLAYQRFGMERIFTALAIGALALGGRHAYRHLKTKRKNAMPKARLEVWEGEGGAVPVSQDRTAAQVSPKPPSPRADS